jgi:hypothetical protein
LPALHPFGGNLTAGLTLGGGQNGSYIVNLAGSGETQITMQGTGHQQITAATGSKENFLMGISATGGSTISNLSAADKDQVDVGGGAGLATRVGTVATASPVVTAPGQWAFGANHVLSWWDSTHNQVDTLTLVGAADLSLKNGHNFTVL